MRNKISVPYGFIGKKDAAQFMGCQVRSIENWMKLKLIPYYKFGRRVLFKEQDPAQAIEKKRVDAL